MNVPAADALDLEEKNRLALEQLDLQVKKKQKNKVSVN
jgi:hypothetical protein